METFTNFLLLWKVCYLVDCGLNLYPILLVHQENDVIDPSKTADNIDLCESFPKR